MTVNPMDLTGRRVLVTGATGGIGWATAELCAKLGACLIVSGRDVDRLADARSRLPVFTKDTEPHISAPYDLSDVDGLPAWLKDLSKSYGPIDGIAHVGGVQATRPIRMTDHAFMDEVMAVNLFAALALAKGFRQKGVHSDQASLVFVSSSAALRTAPGNVVYAASKGGVVSATKGLGVELLRDGVRVNCVAPAMIETDMAERFRNSISDEAYQRVIDMHPLGIGQPEDVANAIAFLLSDASKWMTGSVMCVDGGFLA